MLNLGLWNFKRIFLKFTFDHLQHFFSYLLLSVWNEIYILNKFHEILPFDI